MIDDDRSWYVVGRNSSDGNIVLNVPVTLTVTGSSGFSVVRAAVGAFVGNTVMARSGNWPVVHPRRFRTSAWTSATTVASWLWTRAYRHPSREALTIRFSSMTNRPYSKMPK